jgi:hypothetical protein
LPDEYCVVLSVDLPPSTPEPWTLYVVHSFNASIWRNHDTVRMGQVSSTLEGESPQIEAQPHENLAQRPIWVGKPPAVAGDALKLQSQTRCHIFMLVVDVKAREMWYAASGNDFSESVCNPMADNEASQSSSGLSHLADVLCGDGPGAAVGRLVWKPCAPKSPISSSMSRAEATSFGIHCTALQRKIEQLDPLQYRVAMLIQGGSGKEKVFADVQSAARLRHDSLWQQLQAAMGRLATVDKHPSHTAHASAQGGDD